jgi:hypothetical protein
MKANSVQKQTRKRTASCSRESTPGAHASLGQATHRGCAMSTQVYLSKGFEVYVTVVSVHAIFTPAERFSGGQEHPVPLAHTNSRKRVKEWAYAYTHGRVLYFWLKRPITFRVDSKRSVLGSRVRVERRVQTSRSSGTSPSIAE